MIRAPRLALSLVFVSALGLAAVRGGAAPGAPQDEITLDARSVAGNVWMIEGQGGFAGGNLAVLAGPDGGLVVDGFVEPLRDKLDAKLGQVLGDQEGRARFMINTHWHADHTGNNGLIAADGGEIVAHANVRRRLVGDPALDGRSAEGTPAAALPSLTFEDGVVLHLAGETVRVEHVGPAHTDGDSIVWFESAKVVHLGDVMFNGLFPFVDLTTGGSHVGLLASVNDVLERIDDDWHIIPGHGPLARRVDLLDYRDMLQSCIERVSTGVAEGRTFEDLMQAGLLDDYAPKWRWNFIDERRFLNGLVEEFSRDR